MRTSFAIAAAAAIGLGASGMLAAPASAGPASSPAPIVHHGAAPQASGMELVQYRGRAYRHAAPRRWHRGHYPRHSYRHYRHRDRGAAAAAGIIGFATGAILGQALTAPRYHSAHVQWCQARYRSYDARIDAFRGYDGNLYRCRSPYVAR